MNMDILVSIMIATFNSGKLLSRTLKAIKEQTYQNVEILLIDGGSTDNTKEIGEQYGCRIFDNPKTDPVSGKLIGINNAKGKFLLTLDHDEVIINPKSIELKVQALSENASCHIAFCSGYRKPKDYPLLNQYISEYGDPFSLFVYRFSKDYTRYEHALDKTFNIVTDNKNIKTYSLEVTKKNTLIELICLGTMIDIEYFKATTDVCISPSVMVNLFYYELSNTKNTIALIEEDPLDHYSADSIKAYFPKLKWRIINNVYFSDKAKNGFIGRAKLQKSIIIKIKTLLFVPYSLLIIPAVIDGVIMTLLRFNPVYILHPIFAFYVSIEIIVNILLRGLGYKPLLKSYDGKKIIENE